MQFNDCRDIVGGYDHALSSLVFSATDTYGDDRYGIGGLALVFPASHGEEKMDWGVIAVAVRTPRHRSGSGPRGGASR